MIRPAPSTDLVYVFNGVLDTFRSSYVLHYVPRGMPRPGFHGIRVTVQKGSYDIRSRLAYVVDCGWTPSQ